MNEARQVLNKQSLGIAEGLPLQVSDGGIEELRKDIQMLMDIEAIKQLKHAYLRCIDTANMDELATLFHDDVVVDLKGGNYHWQLNGKAEYLGSVGASFNKRSVGQHHGHCPEIKMQSETEATAVWYLEDHFWALDHKAHTTGSILYWDRYVKENGKWLIRETHYERLYEISETLDELPEFSSHYLAVHGTEPQA